VLAAAQAVEHYEVTRYGTLNSWAEKLGMTDAVKLLDATLMEEKTTDLKLTDLAESEINVEAVRGAHSRRRPRRLGAVSNSDAAHGSSSRVSGHEGSRSCPGIL
jgi:hypothetical protein